MKLLSTFTGRWDSGEIGNREAYYADDKQDGNNRSTALVMRLELG